MQVSQNHRSEPALRGDGRHCRCRSAAIETGVPLKVDQDLAVGSCCLGDQATVRLVVLDILREVASTPSAVAGGLASAVSGMGGIPMRAPVVGGERAGAGFGDRRCGLDDLQELAAPRAKPLPTTTRAVIRESVRERCCQTSGTKSGRRPAQRAELRRVLPVPAGERCGDEAHRMAYVADNNYDLDAVLGDILDVLAALRVSRAGTR